ncbi:MAG: TIGR03435 family protein [Acidobacteriaceae bacterium]|jgi:uncharacterized protein (TIGR03435 family)
MDRRNRVKGFLAGLAAMCAAISVPFAFAQEPAACPDAGGLFAAYDVTSVKPVHPDRILSMGVRELPDGINGENVTVAMLVQGAYSTAGSLPVDDAVAGLPDWGKSDLFSVQAKISPDQIAAFAKLDKSQQRACREQMMQALLADRLKLKVHHETRQVAGYDLVVAKGGLKVKDGETPTDDGPKLPDGRSMPLRLSVKNGAEELTVRLYSMPQLAGFLTRTPAVGHSVVDKTGLTGKYSFTLTFTAAPGLGPAGGPSMDATPPDESATIFAALEEQLGLHLQRGTVTVDTIVVDHVERPSGN